MMKVSFFSSEAFPFAKTGGLADVAGALPASLAKRKISVRVFLPLYGCVDRKKFGIKKIAAGKLNMKDLFLDYSVYKTRTSGTDFYFISQKRFFSRPGIYGPPGGDYKDNALRFIFFQKAALDFLKKRKMRTDIFHINDWQTALIPRFLPLAGLRGKTVLTIHNLAYQGIFDVKFIQYASMSASDLHFGRINFLLDGIKKADFVTTVSPFYARQILTRKFGCGLEKFLRRKNVKGILNGIDYDEWNPALDKSIAENYSAVLPRGKDRCKEALMKELSLDAGKTPLFGFVGRAADQKGFDIIADSLEGILQKNVSFVFLCDGDRRYKEILTKQKKRHPRGISVNFRFDEVLARKIYAASDFFLMPSRFEPCGLAQMIAMRYGAIPVVNPIGGLRDTVLDIDGEKRKGSGIYLKNYSPSALSAAVHRAAKLFDSPVRFRSIRREIMKKRFSWDASARGYIGIYKKLSCAR
ncbi:MAG: glycogen synthase [Elusimicrobia bacterium]|nr:glycogen synthase [Elusimicrobiota bacterium]